MDNFKQITVFQFVNLSVDSVPSLTEIQFWVLANSFLGGWGEGGLWMGGYGISLHTMADLSDLRSGVFFFSGKTRKSYKSEEGPPDRRLQPWLFHCLQIHCLTNGSKYSHTKKSVFSDNPLFASLAKLIWANFYKSGCCFRPLYESFTGVLFLKPFCHYKQT